MDWADEVAESNAAEQAVLDMAVGVRDYGVYAVDETGRRCDLCKLPLRWGFEIVQKKFCSVLCSLGGHYFQGERHHV